MNIRTIYVAKLRICNMRREFVLAISGVIAVGYVRCDCLWPSVGHPLEIKSRVVETRFVDTCPKKKIVRWYINQFYT